MTILITGATGVVGTQVIVHLQKEGAEVRALTRSPEKAKFAEKVTPVKGELSDIEAMRVAMKDIDTLFLLVPNAADELTQALQAMSIAREAGVKGIVYLSVFKGAEYVDVPHFTSKHTVERMIEQMNLSATVLRPAYFIQNDVRQKDALLGHGIYGMPVGSKGISMVDVRDIGDAAARELLRRERADAPLPRAAFELVGPDALTADSIVAIWAAVLQRPIRYVGDNLDTLESRLKQAAPGWLAYDMRLMMQRYQQDGAVAASAELDAFTALLGRAPRTYRDFAEATAKEWASN
ncbi:NmrA family protein [Paraburkholderia ribeironis]|uniref:NmrA family protein n=1 Tax=Paraburkholderia ribeironis TaxID=1247936 RepID=A0A1N7SGX9_9BURK|nr:NmrA family NAD(P)-binding protein [Paraburkholderia ribeironis]SIT46534.1 NmrA family protein [Paraburkholderia ribeironis]